MTKTKTKEEDVSIDIIVRWFMGDGADGDAVEMLRCARAQARSLRAVTLKMLERAPELVRATAEDAGIDIDWVLEDIEPL